MSEWVYHYNCEFKNIYQKLPVNYKEYIIEIAIPRLTVNGENSTFKDWYQIKISAYDFKEKLYDFKNGKINRCHGDWGTTDIDIYKRNNKYYIMENKVGIINVFEFDKENFQRLFNDIICVIETK